jgi:predicted KAP-like P-loop ATPase
MDRETLRRVEEVLEDLEAQLLKRIPEARRLSPETLLDEIEALAIVLDVRSKIAAAVRLSGG